MIMIFLSASKCNTGDKFSNKGIIENDVFKAEIVKEGYIDCFPNKSLVVSCEEISGIYEINCEASAIEFINQELYIASDKRLPDYAKSESPIFKISFPIPENPNIVPVDSEVILGAEKFEDLSSTVDGEYLFAITAFDRQRVNAVASFDKNFDRFNNLIYWKPGALENIKVVNNKARYGIESSTSLRQLMKEALNPIAENIYKVKDFDYFKIEGLSWVADDKLLIGVREIGENYNNSIYTIIILEMLMDREDDIFSVTSINYLYHVENKDLNRKIKKKRKLGLSGLEYDERSGSLFMLTSYEPVGKKEVCDKQIGAYIWVLDETAIRNGESPNPIMNIDGTPIHFKHKAEGITLLGNNTFIVVGDDDRVTGHEQLNKPELEFKRYHNQMPYTILKIFPSK